MFKPSAPVCWPLARLESIDCCSLSLEQLLSIIQSSADAVPPVPIADDTMLCYVYTGGHVEKTASAWGNLQSHGGYKGITKTWLGGWKIR